MQTYEEPCSSQILNPPYIKLSRFFIWDVLKIMNFLAWIIILTPLFIVNRCKLENITIQQYPLNILLCLWNLKCMYNLDLRQIQLLLKTNFSSFQLKFMKSSSIICNLNSCRVSKLYYKVSDNKKIPQNFRIFSC